MEMLTATPRLRNTALIGKRFTVEADNTVKANLDELNRLLGKSVFVENLVSKPKDLDEEFEEQKDAVALAESEAESLKLVAENSNSKLGETREEKIEAETELEGITDRVNDAKQKLVTLKENPKQNAVQIRQLGAEIKQLSNEQKSKARKLKTVVSKFEDAEDEANTDKVNANEKSVEAQRLRKELTEDMLNFAKSNPAVSEDEQFDLQKHLRKALTPKKTKDPKWANDSLLEYINETNDGDDKLSMSDCIDMVNELASLKNTLNSYIDKNWSSLTDNQKIILDSRYKNIADYLLAYGYWVKGITEVNAIFNFITQHPRGVQSIAYYTAVSSVRTIIKSNAIRINDYNDDSNDLMKRIGAANASLKKESFLKEIDKHLKAFISNGQDIALIEHGLAVLKVDDLSESDYPEIIKLIRNSAIKIDKDNIAFFLPGFINSVSGEVYEDESTDEDYEVSDSDFDVTFVKDERTAINANASNVKCAAQLFTSMVMESELDIIGLANYFTDYYLSRNRIQIEDDRLRSLVDMFMFDNQFLYYDGKKGRTTEKNRTNPNERHQVYKLVFNYGGGQALQDTVVNTKFPKLWKKLVPVVKEFVENSASSLSQNSFVSKGGVMSLVSALQTNLSTNCTNVATVMSPRINGEWNFIVFKIFSHPEIIRQISPTMPSWKGVVETLYASYKRKNVDATLVYEKAELCNSIIREIAEYNPAVFEEDDHFLNFCSKVIQLDENNNSIEEFMDEMEEVSDKHTYNGNGSTNGTANQQPKSTEPVAADEWDF